MNSKRTFRVVTRRRQEAGQAMVEFMLTISVVFIVILSMMQIILLMHSYNTLADAAKEGIRYQVVHGTGNTNCSGPSFIGTTSNHCPDQTGANVQAWVMNFASVSFQTLSASNVTVDYNPNNANSTACNTPGCLVRVTVSVNYQPFFGLGWPSVALNAAADGRIMN